MPEYKITYFNVKALAEPMRFLLAYGNIDFEDVRIEKENWPAIKDSKFVIFLILKSFSFPKNLINNVDTSQRNVKQI